MLPWQRGGPIPLASDRSDPFRLAPRIAERSTTALALRPQPVCAAPGGTCLIEGMVYV